MFFYFLFYQCSDLASWLYYNVQGLIPYGQFIFLMDKNN